ncbi:hypothetical protein [Haloarcula marina]|uniref:hypothetical protein n=1 Tax=Haloarcula marina TaxID=2961574 RepID=UPI0020B6CA45|nr:hypothetical protein [Halomicroarcula marina]
MSDNHPDAIKDSIVAQAATLFDVHDNVARVIRDLTLPLNELQDEYNITSSKTFDFEGMLRLYLYKEVAGMDQSEVTDKVKKWPYLRMYFGLDRAPTQQALSYTERKRFSYDLRQLIRDVARGIRSAAKERDIYYSDLRDPVQRPAPDVVEESQTPIHHYVDNHAPDIISTALDDVCPVLDTGRRHNTVHEDQKVWEHQLTMSLADRAGTRSAFRTFNKFRGNALHHDTHLRAVKKLATPSSYQYTFDDFGVNRNPISDWRRIADTVNPQFSDAVDNLLETIRPAETFTEPLAAAIDMIRVPYSTTPYKGESDVESGDRRVVVNEETGKTRVPKDDYPAMVNGKEGEYAYEYATLTIVGRNAPIVLAVEPVRHHSNWEGASGESVPWAEIVDRLMEQATELVDIHLVMADRAFENAEVAHVLDQYYDVDYLMPKKKNSKEVKQEVEVVRYDPTLKSRVVPYQLYLDEDSTRYVDAENDETVGENAYSHDVNFMYVPAERDDWIHKRSNDVKYTVFTTNRDDVAAVDAPGFVDRYSDRWDIEIEYKMIKPMLPSIASRDYRMRYFSFVFSCLLYNLWRLVDHSLKVLVTEAYDDYGRSMFDDRLDPLLPMADLLASSLILFMCGDGLDPPD